MVFGGIQVGFTANGVKMVSIATSKPLVTLILAQKQRCNSLHLRGLWREYRPVDPKGSSPFGHSSYPDANKYVKMAYRDGWSL